MSLLVIQIPTKPRQRARLLRHEGDGTSASSASSEFEFVWSADGSACDKTGRSAPALMPKADRVVAALADTDVSWHKLLIPKAPANRMPAALAGLLEEALLEDPATTHFALAAQARPGAIDFVAVTDRRWLQRELAAIEQSHLSVDRIVPMAWPVDPPLGHFSTTGATAGGTEAVALSWADANGVAIVGLDGSLARALLPTEPAAGTRFSASPAAAAAAEGWLGAPVDLLTDPQRLLQAAQSPWNLRQFELARRHKGSRALRDAWRGLLGPAWRPVRIGLVALLVVQLVGLNAWAAQLRGDIGAKRAEMVNLLRGSFPQITGILDAPLQMRREVETLRAAAGKPGGSDLEPLLLAAAAAWPAGKAPAQNLRFEPGRLSIAADDWLPPEIDRFSARLRASGYNVALAEGRLQIGPAPARGAR
ncbi:type II secretion system protein GspL [Piscinibacter sakaiensis]|uniref:type II secretion system protein GspL n=1 Tax=Piscinibacter sakaiensis TaxID=1547922 RepID=UPI003AACF70F